MENRRSFNVLTICFFLIGGVLALASWFILNGTLAFAGNQILFWTSITTSSASVIYPLLSFRIFKLTSRNSKVYSLVFGLFVLLLLLFLSQIGVEFIDTLEHYSDQGLLWGVNLSLLAFNLSYLEVKNIGEINTHMHEKKMKELQQLREIKEKLLESEKNAIFLKNQLIEEKKLRLQENSYWEGERNGTIY